MRAKVICSLLFVLFLCACGKPSAQHSSTADPCADAKGAASHETDAQAIQACHANKNFSGPDVKRSHIQITNH